MENTKPFTVVSLKDSVNQHLPAKSIANPVGNPRFVVAIKSLAEPSICVLHI